MKWFFQSPTVPRRGKPRWGCHSDWKFLWPDNMSTSLHLPFNAYPSTAALSSEKGPGVLCAGGGILAWQIIHTRPLVPWPHLWYIHIMDYCTEMKRNELLTQPHGGISKHYIEWQTPDTRRYLLYDFIYMKSKNRQNQTVLTEFRRVVVFEGRERQERAMRRKVWDMRMFHILIGVLVIWVYTFFNTFNCILTLKLCIFCM